MRVFVWGPEILYEIIGYRLFDKYDYNTILNCFIISYKYIMI